MQPYPIFHGRNTIACRTFPTGSPTRRLPDDPNGTRRKPLPPNPCRTHARDNAHRHRPRRYRRKTHAPAHRPPNRPHTTLASKETCTRLCRQLYSCRAFAFRPARRWLANGDRVCTARRYRQTTTSASEWTNALPNRSRLCPT